MPDPTWFTEDHVFKEEDAIQHTRYATGPRLAHLWANVANYYMSLTRDPVTAIRKANYAVAKKKGRAAEEPKEQARLRHSGQRHGFPRFGSDRGH